MKKLALLIVALSCVVSLSAQQSKSDKSVEFRPHWDLQLQGGVGYTIGESSRLGDLISPALNLSTNYRFHHAMGVRIGIGGWQGKGVIVSPMQKYSFNFMQLSADYKLDLTSLIGGYNHKRPVAFYVLAGVGANYGFGNDEANAIAAGNPAWSNQLEYLWDSKFFVAGRFGLGLDFRVGERVLINLEGNANVLSDHFNSKRAENADWQLNLLAGVSYSFGKKHQVSQAWLDEQAAIKRAEEERIERERIAEEKRVAEEKRIAEEKRVAEEKRIAEEKEAEAKRLAAAVRAENVAAHSEDIFFTIGSHYIRKAEMEKIARLAEWLKANPDYQVDVVGYADKETGYAVGNLKLSERRAANVKKALIEKGVEETRIISDHKGDTEQPFEKNSENRVVICTLQ